MKNTKKKPVSEKHISFRITAEEYDDLLHRARCAGLSTTDYIKHAIFHTFKLNQRMTLPAYFNPLTSNEKIREVHQILTSLYTELSSRPHSANCDEEIRQANIFLAYLLFGGEHIW